MEATAAAVVADRRSAITRITRSVDGQVRAPSRGASLAAAVMGFVAIAGGCASGSSSPATTSGTTAGVTVSTTTTATASSVATTPRPSAATTSPTSATSAAPPATTQPIDPAATLQQGLVGLGANYHFTTVATVDGTAILTADGDRIADGQRFAVTSNGATIQYVITPDGTWVQQAGQEWQQVDDPPATADPITALGAPTSVALADAQGTTVTLTVTVPATAIGVAADGDVPLTATVADGALTGVSYTTAVGAKPATVQATFGPASDASPVTAPA